MIIASFAKPIAFPIGWIFMMLLPFDCSIPGTNGLICRQYSRDRQGTLQELYFVFPSYILHCNIGSMHLD